MKTSIIVCTYNEADTIFGVVAACCKHNPEAEVIVVDDGSTDNTSAILETLAIHHKFEYLELSQNHGTSYAMAYGIEYASNEVIVFFNANVKEVREQHFSSLVEPIYRREADLVLGTPSGLTVDFGLNPYKSVLGQKAMLKADLIPILNDIREIRFGVESFIALYYQTIGKRIHFAMLNGLQNRSEETEDHHLPVTESANMEIANALLSNMDLITKRVQNTIHKTKNYTQSTISSVQIELNRKMKMLKEKNRKMELAS
uniref:glycosyltransferase family 2 protein n=1 Tax=uncultured Draconibacterium sp. TaxID=1573823 RepID=UPI0032180515